MKIEPSHLVIAFCLAVISFEADRAAGADDAGRRKASDLPRTSAPIVVDLDADEGLTVENGDRVTAWQSQADFRARDFVRRDEGRTEPGSGRPVVRRNIAELNGHAALTFLQQELVCMDEEAFDDLTRGAGLTWLAVIAVRAQGEGLKDVHSFFGNLKNGGNFEGFWGCVKDDNTLWWGARNGLTFGRFDQNNPQIVGPKLDLDRFHIVAGRLGSGIGTAKLELFLDSAIACATGDFPVQGNANPSKLAIGQERDAINHPGHESFRGDIARFLIWRGALTDSELRTTISVLGKRYGIQVH